jgi:hypothetical protein
MGDPERLLSSISDSDHLERELLASIHRMDPPSDAQAEGWARLSAQIAAVSLVGTVHATAAAASAAQGGLAAAHGAAATSGVSATGLIPAALKILSSKLAVALAVSGVAVGASAVWVETHKPSAPPPSPVAAQQALPPVSAQLAAALPAPDPALQLVPDSDPGKQSPSADQHRRDMLSAESALITQARAQLRNGDANAAQQLLRTLHQKFPKGMLRQEREVLAIEVLAARGNASAAQQRARAFIAAHPESPHSAQLSRFADAP